MGREQRHGEEAQDGACVARLSLAPAIAPAAVYLPADILSDRGRIFRPPVRRWAPSLTRQLRAPAHAPGDPRHTWDVCALANNASLLFALAGDSAFAQIVCESQLAWLHRRVRAGGGAQAASLAIQPWVNIGRLYRQRGWRDRALAQFEAIFPRGGAPLHFGPFRLPAGDIAFEDVELLYVIDTLRTFHAARAWERGLRFARRLRPLLTSAAAISRLDEYEFQLLLGRGFRRAAERVLDRPQWEGPLLMIVNAFYRCILLDGAAAPVLGDLAAWACTALAGAAPDHSVLRFTLDLARFAAFRGDRALAAPLIAAGYATATRLDDVPLRADFAGLSAQCGLGACPSARDILIPSGYAAIARRHGVVMSVSPDDRTALAALAEALTAVLDS